MEGSGLVQYGGAVQAADCEAAGEPAGGAEGTYRMCGVDAVQVG